ncbi:MAG: pitrilysin family protein [Coxiella burnetii]|nr:pitrilysin family protein [Coxiella burnetii]
MRLLIVTISLFISLNVFASESTPLVNIQHWETKNGAKVYFVRASEIPMVDIQVVFAAGSSYDGQAWGLASFTNSMLAEGTTTQNANQIAMAFDRVGAQYSNGVDRDMAMLSLRSLTRPDFLKPALKTFADVLTESTFPQKAFIRVKHQLLSSIEYNEQSPNVVASKAFYSAIYGTHPYGHPPAGTIKTINAITNDEVKSFYQKFYVANNANVVIVGDLTREQAQGIVAQVIGALPTGKPAPVLPEAITASGVLRQQIPFLAQQTTIILGQVAIKLASADYFPLVVGNQVLGGLPLSSLLFDQVRNQRGLTYGAYSQLAPLKYGGPFYISLQTRKDKAADALKITQSVLQHFVEKGPTLLQLQAAKNNIIGNFPLQLSTNASVLANVTNMVFYGLPLDYLDTYRQNIRAVDTQQVTAAFQKTIRPAQLKIVEVGSSTPLKGGEE